METGKAVMRLGLAAGLVLVVSCADSPLGPFEDPEDVATFRRDILADVDKVDGFLREVRAGKDISDFRLGWFAFALLVEVSAHDPELFDYLHRGDNDIESYLRDVFRAAPDREVAAIEAMARQGHSTFRLAARHTLDALRHLPAVGDPPAVRAARRQELAAALTALQGVLRKGEREEIPR